MIDQNSEKTLLIHTPEGIRLSTDSVQSSEAWRICKPDDLALECKFLLLDAIKVLTDTQLTPCSELATEWKNQEAAEELLTTVYAKWEETLQANVSDECVTVGKRTALDPRVEDLELLLKNGCDAEGMSDVVQTLGTVCELPHAYDRVIVRSKHYPHHRIQLVRRTPSTHSGPYQFTLASVNPMRLRKEGRDFPKLTIERQLSGATHLRLDTSTLDMSAPHVLNQGMLDDLCKNVSRKLEQRSLEELSLIKHSGDTFGARLSMDLVNQWAWSCRHPESRPTCEKLDLTAVTSERCHPLLPAATAIRNDWLACPSVKEGLQKPVEHRAREATSLRQGESGWEDNRITRDVGNKVYGYLDQCERSADPFHQAIKSSSDFSVEIMRSALDSSKDCVGTIRDTVEASWRLRNGLLEQSPDTEDKGMSGPKMSWKESIVQIRPCDDLSLRSDDGAPTCPEGVEVSVSLRGEVDVSHNMQNASAMGVAEIRGSAEQWRTTFSQRLFFKDVPPVYGDS
jgi:hypothetical protein